MTELRAHYYPIDSGENKFRVSMQQSIRRKFQHFSDQLFFKAIRPYFSKFKVSVFKQFQFLILNSSKFRSMQFITSRLNANNGANFSEVRRKEWSLFGQCPPRLREGVFQSAEQDSFCQLHLNYFLLSVKKYFYTRASLLFTNVLVKKNIQY